MKIAIKRQIQMPSTFSGKQLNTESDKEKEKKWQKKRHEKNREKKINKNNHSSEKCMALSRSYRAQAKQHTMKFA